MSESLPPELQHKLEQVEQAAENAAYPNYRRGLRWGAVVTALILLPDFGFALTSAQHGVKVLLSGAFAALFIGFIVFCFGAFRPPSGGAKG